MLEIIKNQFERGRTLTQSKHYNLVNRGAWPKFYWEMYPLAQEYYHELNPYFVFNLYREEFFNFSKVITVRDGYINFADFMVKNISLLTKLDDVAFLIHPSLAPIVPSSLYHRFASWQIVQKNQLQIRDAKKVIIFGFACEQYLGKIEDLPKKLEMLKDLPAETSIEIYLPLRRDIFKLEEKESLVIHRVMSYLKDTIPNKEIKFLTGDHFFEISNFKDTFIYDLSFDNFIVSDNYLHYYVQSRGGSVNNNSLKKAPKDSMFCLDLSIHHELHVTPLIETDSVFADLLLYKKMNPSSRELVFDPLFQKLVRDRLKKEF